jgi:hypothetical protein
VSGEGEDGEADSVAGTIGEFGKGAKSKISIFEVIAFGFGPFFKNSMSQRDTWVVEKGG